MLKNIRRNLPLSTSTSMSLSVSVSMDTDTDRDMDVDVDTGRFLRLNICGFIIQYLIVCIIFLKILINTITNKHILY
jgi:hypothetical protein